MSADDESPSSQSLAHNRLPMADGDASNGTGNTARGLTVAIALFFCWALLFFAVRVWVKLKKRDSWSLDDVIVSLALVTIVARIACVTDAVHHGFGNPWSSLSEGDDQVVSRLLYSSQILYVLAIGLVKVSTSLFAARFLAVEKRRVRLTHATTAVCVVWTVVSILVIALRPDLSAPWLTREGRGALFFRWIAIEVSGLAIELWAVGFSIFIVWTLQMPVMKRLLVSTLFGCRLLVAPVIAIRLWQLSPSENRDLDNPAITGYILTEGVLELTFILASATCLRPFMRPYHSGWVVSTGPHGYASGYASAQKDSARDAYVELSVANSMPASGDGSILTSKKERNSQIDRGSHTRSTLATKPETLVTRPDRVDYEATAVLGEQPSRSHTDSLPASIVKTQAWAVSYDQASPERDGGS